MAIGGELARLFVTVGANTKTFWDEMRKVERSYKGIEKTADLLKNAGMAMSAAITLPVAGLGALSLKSAADFEQAGNKMQAISGATGEQMDQIREKALQLGKDTVFSAGEAMQGMLELSKAGLDVNKAMEAIPGTLNLAAAASVDVAQAAEIASNALNTFGLKADQIGSVANILAATANASSVEMTDLADSLQMVGAVASNAGVKIDTVATALGIMGNNGIKGSDAGTSLKQMLLSLQNPTDKAAAILEKMNVHVYDQTGKMNTLKDILDQFARATSRMTQEQRDAALATLFGSDAVRAATILIKNSGSSWDDMAKSVGNASAAQIAADANMKGLSGAIEYFKGTLDTLLIQTGTPWLDMLNNMVRGVADLFAKFGDLSPEVQKAITVFAVLVATIGPALLVIGTLAGSITKIIALKTAWTAVSAAAAAGNAAVGATSAIASPAVMVLGTAFNFLLAPIGLAIIAIGGAIAIGVLLYKHWDEVKEFLENAWNAIAATAIIVWDKIKAFFSEWWETLLVVFTGPIGILVLLVVKNWDAVASKTTEIWNSIAGFLSGVWDTIKTSAANTFNSIKSFLSSVWASIRTMFDDAFGGMIGSAFDFGKRIMESLKSAIGSVSIPLPSVSLSFSEGPLGIKVPDLDIGVNWRSLRDIVPFLAEGGNVLRSGLTLVGERGPELLDLPAGAQVSPLSRAASSRTGDLYLEVNVYGSVGVDDIGEQIVRTLRREGVLV